MERKLTSFLAATLLLTFVLTLSVPVFAIPPRTGQLYYDGMVVRTLVPSNKPLQKEGIDPLYAFPDDEVEGVPQYSVTRYAPGDKEYREDIGQCGR